MKKLKMSATSLIMLIFLLGVLMASCKKENQSEIELNAIDQILGTYTGTFNDDGLKTIITAKADVTMNADSSIWVHCYGGEYDTAFMLDVFNQNDSIYVCLTGDDFMNEYGHARNHQGSMMNGSGGNGMGGNMMGNTTLSSDSTGWMFHLREDHHGTQEDHFGGFDMNNHTFGYSFRNPDNTGMYITFQGSKNQ